MNDLTHQMMDFYFLVSNRTITPAQFMGWSERDYDLWIDFKQPWIETVYILDDQNDRDGLINTVFNYLDTLISNNDWKEINSILDNLNLDRLSALSITAFVAVLLPYKHNIACWNKFYDNYKEAVRC